MSDRQDQIIALSGISRAALWTHLLASKGDYDPARVQQAVGTVLCTDPASASDVFGGFDGTSVPEIADGLTVLRTQLGGQPLSHPRPEVTLMSRYFSQMLRLSSRLQKDNGRLQEISESIARIRHSGEVMDAGTDHVTQRLAATYQSTLSTLNPRIMIQGDKRYLENQHYTNAIRVFLLSGVRSGVLWRQCGGRMWQLFLMRGQLLQTARDL